MLHDVLFHRSAHGKSALKIISKAKKMDEKVVTYFGVCIDSPFIWNAHHINLHVTYTNQIIF